tara:strand:- start:255 stop:395 length:141 start_codon:yes stop_codon:yes gene_type:complete
VENSYANGKRNIWFTGWKTKEKENNVDCQAKDIAASIEAQDLESKV